MRTIIASTYEIIEKIGSGGGGNVFLANHIRLNKKVILKADKRKLKTRPELLRREVDVLKELHHNYIPQVYDFFVEDETVYTVMEYIDGESLDKPLKRGETFSQAQIIKWAKQLLEALSYLHSPVHGTPPRGFVHSDIKPANLMRLSNDDICLIDFNISLALGEENIVGRSVGYSSPEHYGLDYSKIDVTNITDVNSTITMELDDRTKTLVEDNSENSLSVRRIVPDIRSDIYSVGATLYHLLSGERPSSDIAKVKQLSEKQYNAQLVRIISKAMNLNPLLRYQSADEMLQDFKNLQKNDCRSIRLRKKKRIVYSVLSIMLGVGIGLSFLGLKRMQLVEKKEKLVEFSQNAYEKGDVSSAIQYALEALPEKNVFNTSDSPKAQCALAQAMGVYDLADNYYKKGVIKMPMNIRGLVISPQGRSFICLQDDEIAIVDLKSHKILEKLQTIDSVLVEFEYLNEDTIIYAGKEGITCYDFKNKKKIWQGNLATGITISGDKKRVAAIYKDENKAIVYDTKSGNIVQTVDFGKYKQKVTMVMDYFVNAKGNVWSLNEDGTFLAVSFDDDSLHVLDLNNRKNDLKILEKTAENRFFEGGFYKNYFAFSASDKKSSVFGIINCKEQKQSIGFQSPNNFHVKLDEHGIYVQNKNVLVQIDPATGEEMPLVSTEQTILDFAVSSKHTVILQEKELLIYDRNFHLVKEVPLTDALLFLELGEEHLIYSNFDTSNITVLKYEDYSDKKVVCYDVDFKHVEARMSPNKKTTMLFSYKEFRIIDNKTGEIIIDGQFPNEKEIYDQQYVRRGEKAELIVIYKDGEKVTYDALQGKIVKEEKGPKPNGKIEQVFETKQYKMMDSTDGETVIIEKNSGCKKAQLDEEAFLTYVYELPNYFILQYVTGDGYQYGVLLNQECEKIAKFPYLCDVWKNELYFDCPGGNIRKTKIASLKQLKEEAKKYGKNM